jgi:hypothetical protein
MQTRSTVSFSEYFNESLPTPVRDLSSSFEAAAEFGRQQALQSIPEAVEEAFFSPSSAATTPAHSTHSLSQAVASVASRLSSPGFFASQWDAAEMSGLSLEDITAAVKVRQFTGSSEQCVHDWTEVWRQKAMAAAGNPKLPLCAATLASIMHAGIPQSSPAHSVVKHIRRATAPWVQWADSGRFMHYLPTQEVVEAALGSNALSRVHCDMAHRELEQQFKDLINAASQQQLVVTPASGPPSAHAAGTPGLALRPAPKAIITADGDKVSTQLYAFLYILAIIELRYGQATLQQENAFKQLKQGAHSLDSYAIQIRRSANKLKHRAEYDEAYCTTLFIEGLNNKECSQHLHAAFSNHAPGSYTLDRVVAAAEQWERHQQKRLQVVTETAVAARMADATRGGKTPSSLFPQQFGSNVSGSSSGTGTPSLAQAKRLYMQAVKDKHGPEHPDAPCKMQGHRGHSNSECDLQRRDAGRQTAAPQFRQPAAAMHYNVSTQDARYSTAEHGCGSSSSSGSYHMPAAAMQTAGVGKQVRWEDQKRAAATHYPRQQQQQQLPRPPGLQQQPTECQICGWQGGHRNGFCYYDRPDTAPADWRPSPKASEQLLQHYREQCRRAGRHPKEPHPPAVAPQQGAQKPVGSLTEWEQQWEESDPVLESPGEPQSWFTAGSLAEHVEPAAVGTRARQPHSFMPADNTQPRVKLAAAADTAVPPMSVPLQLNITANVDVRKLEQLLSLLYGQHSPAQAAASPSAAETPQDPTGALQQQSALEAHVLEQLGLPEVAADPEEVQSLLEQHAENTQAQHLHIFSSSTPSSGVTMQWGPKGSERHIQPSRAASDSGCVPSIISESLVRATGLAVRDLTQEEKEKVRAIDGTVSSRIYGRTEPITITLCKGTPQEVSLTSQRGFLAVKGVDASHMYDVVLGRDLLDQVSGFVVPLINSFFYMPRMQHGDLSLHSMPVASGRPAAARSRPMQAAGLADALSYMPACAVILQDDGPAPASEQHQQQPVPQPKPCTADAATQTRQRSKRRQPHTPAAEKESQPVATAAPLTQVSRAWGVVSSTTVCMLLLFFWPVLWLLQCATAGLERTWYRVFSTAMQPPPRKSTTYWRLGRGHRSAAGETIYLHTDARSSGNKPRVVDLYRPCCTFKHLTSTVAAKLLLILLMIAAVGVTGTSAMHTYRAITADSTSITLGQQLVPPMPYSVAHLLAAGLTDHLGPSGKCFRC